MCVCIHIYIYIYIYVYTYEKASDQPFGRPGHGEDPDPLRPLASVLLVVWLFDCCLVISPCQCARLVSE